MTFLRFITFLLCAAMALCMPFGCVRSMNGSGDEPSGNHLPGSEQPASGTIAIIVYRVTNYSGGGRIHLLKLDDREIGEITADNFYRLEIWPGEYKFTIFLPAENFLGLSNPAISISDQVRFGPADVGAVFSYQFTDGMGGRGFERRRMTTQTSHLLLKRSLSGRLSARDTAQVLSFLDARYDGPALHGQPQGKGTLTWPDGAVYQGEFEHGVPTNRARFFFSNGQVFVGLFSKGRPKSPGILMNSEGRILYAGPFVNEKPHGIGLRDGVESPEFCRYDRGQDVTKSFDQLAAEILDIEDQERIEAFPERIDRLTAQIVATRERLFQLKTADHADKDKIAERLAHMNQDILSMENTRASLQRTSEADLKMLISELRSTRFKRKLSKIKELKKDHQAKVEEERAWCEEEFALERFPCGCAPLAADFNTWLECMAPIGKRY